MMFAPLEGWRHVKVTDRHTAKDYAHALRELSDVEAATLATVGERRNRGSGDQRRRRQYGRGHDAAAPATC
jgi:hypothetical protein